MVAPYLAVDDGGGRVVHRVDDALCGRLVIHRAWGEPPYAVVGFDDGRGGARHGCG